MKNNREFRTVEMVRGIRDRHHELLKEKTVEERIAFYRDKAQDVLRHSNEAEGKQVRTGR